MTDSELGTHPSPTKRFLFGMFFATLSLGVVLAGSILFLDTSPSSFPTHTPLIIEPGLSLRDMAYLLEEGGYIRSPLLFQGMVQLKKAELSIRSGAYVFDMPYSTISLTTRIIDGSSLQPATRITIPEGATLAEFASLTEAALPHIDGEELIRKVDGEEGVLFPDTYLIPPYFTIDDIVALMRNTFTERLAPLQDAINTSGMTEREIIILASLIEREANDKESMRNVSSVLHNRLRIEMPLQVDAPFFYLEQKTSEDITLDDLQRDIPLNTYRYRGLPPTPIASPGIMAIEAALFPADTEYYYYLTGNDGVFRYARTFDEHRVNKARYLR